MRVGKTLTFMVLSARHVCGDTPQKTKVRRKSVRVGETLTFTVLSARHVCGFKPPKVRRKPVRVGETLTFHGTQRAAVCGFKPPRGEKPRHAQHLVRGCVQLQAAAEIVCAMWEDC